MKNYTTRLWSALIMAILVAGCTFPRSSRIIRQYDQIKKEKRFSLRMDFFRTKERYTTFYSLEKNFLKIIPSSGKAVIRVYDRLNLSPESYSLSDTLYLIADRQAFPIKMKAQKDQILHQTQTQNNEIMQADSTTVTVVSGIQEYEYKQEQFYYTLNSREIKALQQAKKVSFRYYTQAEMFTLHLTGGMLKKLKKLLAMP
jgi:hypothetical protein